MKTHEVSKERLSSWKEIAAYLDRAVRTVQRWEAEEGLPVHRHTHNARFSVHAYKAELDQWLAEHDVNHNNHGRFRWFSRHVGLGFLAGGLTTLAAAGILFWALSSADSSDQGLNFQERNWVLIADFDNRTGEAIFDGTLEYALEREISTSQFVNVIPPQRIEETLRLMKKPVAAKVDAELGREICLRDGGIAALLEGRIEKLGPTYLLTLKLVNGTDGVTVAATSEEAGGEEKILPAINSLATWARQTLGEELRWSVRNDEDLKQEDPNEKTPLKVKRSGIFHVTTPSLQALQLYREAISHTPNGTAEELLRQVIEIDPNFASAQNYLALSIYIQRGGLVGQGVGKQDYLPYAQRAFDLADATSDRERYFILLGSYYEMTGRLEEAVRAYEALLTLYPDHFLGNSLLSQVYRKLGQKEKASISTSRVHELRWPQDIARIAKEHSGLIQALAESDLELARKHAERMAPLVESVQFSSWWNHRQHR